MFTQCRIFTISSEHGTTADKRGSLADVSALRSHDGARHILMRLIRLFKQDMANEVSDWVDDDVISEEQASQILIRYGIKPGEQQSHGYNLLIGLGLLFIGLSLITLLGANWDDIPRAARMGGLVALTAATQLIGLRYLSQGVELKALGAFFLGNLFFGASIILVAQIYHLGEHMPDGIWWWALGCIPFVLVTKSRILAYQMLALAIIWLLVEADLGFFPASFPLFAGVALYVLLRSQGSTILFLTIIASSALWFEFFLTVLWREDGIMRYEVEHFAVTMSLVASAYGFSIWLGDRNNSVLKDYGTILAGWCLRFLVIALIALSFEDVWDGLIEANWDHAWGMALVCMVFWAIGIGLSWSAQGIRFSLWVLLALFTPSTIAVVMIQNDAHAFLLAVVYNLVLLGVGVWLIVRGLADNISHYFYTGVTVILLTALLRYFDLIGSYVGGAILFMVMAGILLGAARFWRLQQEKLS